VTSQELDDQGLELTNTELVARLGRQTESGTKIDTKAVFVTDFVAAAAQFLATQNPQPGWALAAFMAYGLGSSLDSRRSRQPPTRISSPRELLDTYAVRSRRETLAGLAAARVVIFENSKSIETAERINPAASAVHLKMSR
jgi:hypothetical protein